MYIYGFCAPGSVSLRLVCQHVKEHRQSSFDDAKLQRYENNNPLYRGYNRPYIGERSTDNQRVTLVIKNQVYLLISLRHGSRLLHIPFLLCQVLHIPQHFKRLPLRLQADFHGEGLGDIHGLLACGL